MTTRILCLALLSVCCGGLPPSAAPSRARGEGLGGHCGKCGTACHPGHLVACTVWVPMQVTETRSKSCVVMEPQEREETYTVFRRVPEKRTFYREECYLEDEVKTITVTEKQCHLVMNPVERKVKVPVPEREVRVYPGGPCNGGCPQVCEVTVLREEEQTVTCEEPDVVFETTKRQMDYCVKVPKTKKTVCTEDTVWKLEPVEKTRKVTVCVPKIVQQPCEVTVCRMVPQTVLCCQKCCGRH